VELHPGEYAESRGPARAERLSKLAQAARLARQLGLEVAAGHGLTREIVPAIAGIRDVEELNIGHSVIADAVLVGLERAVRDLRAAVDRGVEARRSTGSGA
jgi:pyridoxine 5-phosphate synthase